MFNTCVVRLYYEKKIYAHIKFQNKCVFNLLTGWLLRPESNGWHKPMYIACNLWHDQDQVLLYGLEIVRVFYNTAQIATFLKTEHLLCSCFLKLFEICNHLP